LAAVDAQEKERRNK